MMQYTIREASVQDINQILSHRRAMFADMGYTDSAGLDAMQASSEPLLRRGLAEGFHHAWLAETAEGKVVAGGGIFLAPWPTHPRSARQTQRAEVINIYCHPAHRRRGLARQIMETILNWCRSQGIATVVLHASDDGRHLYESLGFRSTNEMRLQLKP